MLQLNEQNRIPELDHCYICGELALSDELRPVRGALAIALEARKRRRERLIVPHQNAAEAAVVDGLSVYGATSLSEVVQFLRGEKELAVVPTQPWTAHKIRDESDLSEVKGQNNVRRTVEEAAAGSINPHFGWVFCQQRIYSTGNWWYRSYYYITYRSATKQM